MEIHLLVAAGLGGALVAWLGTYLWARLEIRRAARFGDRRLQSAEWAAEVYRREMESLRVRVGRVEEGRVWVATPGAAEAGGNGDGPHQGNGHHGEGPGETGGHDQVTGGNGNGTHPHDDLKRIRGIGSVLERQLQELDIVSFRQIATWRDEDIDSVASLLRVFPGRIRRDDWVEGARRAHREKYGEDP